MNWLITGGTGQLGIALSRELGIRNISFDSFSSEQLDITNQSFIRDIIRKLNPSVIVNCAAWTDVDGAERNEEQAFKINAIGAENVALVAKECGAKLIHISTDYIFSGNSKNAWKVNDPGNPQTAYGRTKLAGEQKVLNAYSEKTLIVRTAWLYSPWRKNFLNTVLHLATKDSELIRMVTDETGQPTSATDLATRIIELAQSAEVQGIFHATNSGEATRFDFAEEILTLIGEDLTRLVPIKSSEFKQFAPRPTYSVLSQSSWENSGFNPMRDWKQALRHTMRILEIEREKGLREE